MTVFVFTGLLPDDNTNLFTQFRENGQTYDDFRTGTTYSAAFFETLVAEADADPNIDLAAIYSLCNDERECIFDFLVTGATLKCRVPTFTCTESRTCCGGRGVFGKPQTNPKPIHRPVTWGGGLRVSVKLIISHAI